MKRKRSAERSARNDGPVGLAPSDKVVAITNRLASAVDTLEAEWGDPDLWLSPHLEMQFLRLIRSRATIRNWRGAAISRDMIRACLDDVLKGKLIKCVCEDSPSISNEPGKSVTYSLRWCNGHFTTTHDGVDGFFGADGNRTDIPIELFYVVIPDEPLPSSKWTTQSSPSGSAFRPGMAAAASRSPSPSSTSRTMPAPAAVSISPRALAIRLRKNISSAWSKECSFTVMPYDAVPLMP